MNKEGSAYNVLAKESLSTVYIAGNTFSHLPVEDYHFKVGLLEHNLSVFMTTKMR